MKEADADQHPAQAAPTDQTLKSWQLKAEQMHARRWKKLHTRTKKYRPKHPFRRRH